MLKSLQDVLKTNRERQRQRGDRDRQRHRDREAEREREKESERVHERTKLIRQVWVMYLC